MYKIKLTLCFAAVALATSASAQSLLIGWDDATATGNNTPASNDAQDHVFLTGVSGVINDGREAVTYQGSTDGTFGSFGTNEATATNGRYEIRGSGTNAVDQRIAVTITNGTGAGLALDALVFDFSRHFEGSPTAFDVEYRQGLSGQSLGSSNVTLFSASSLAITGVNADLPDYSASISGNVGVGLLDTNILGDGLSATFWMIGSGASGSGNGIIDNIAFSAIPEPSSYALIAGSLALISIMVRRRK